MLYVSLISSLLHAYFLACCMYLPINYINSEEEMTHYSVAQLFKMITLRMVFFFQHLSQSVSSPTLLAVLS
jgi:hypothetical protein